MTARWEELDLNQRGQSQRIYSPSPSTTRTSSQLPRIRRRGRSPTSPSRPDPGVTPTARMSVGSRGGGTRTLQFQAVCLTCYRSVHYPRGTQPTANLPEGEASLTGRGETQGSNLIAWRGDQFPFREPSRRLPVTPRFVRHPASRS